MHTAVSYVDLSTCGKIAQQQAVYTLVKIQSVKQHTKIVSCSRKKHSESMMVSLEQQLHSADQTTLALSLQGSLL